MGVLRDSDSRWYMREEAGGLILGPRKMLHKNSRRSRRKSGKKNIQTKLDLI